jgi:hypothetical protein
VSDSAANPAPSAAEDDLGDLLLEVLPPDGSTMGNRRERAFSLGLVVKNHSRCGSIALANSIKNFRAVLWASADKSIYGQESNPTTWRLAGMNLAIRGFNANLGQEPADTLARDQFPDQSSNHAWSLWGCRRNWMR